MNALDEAHIHWELHQPWNPLKGDLTKYDAVLCWSFNGSRNNFVFWCTRFEAQCRELGIPVINSIDAFMLDHHTCLQKWQEAGVPCARAQHVNEAEDINLDYPLILRVNNQHEAANVFLVNNKAEAGEIMDRQFEDYTKSSKKDWHTRPIDLAIEYKNVLSADGYYHKKRMIVVGDALIPREYTIAKSWVVNLDNRVENDYARSLNRKFFEYPEDEAAMIKKAARALGSDIVALDYTQLDAGSYVFWEGNRHFKMHGNKKYGPGMINPATSRNYEEMVAIDARLGKEIVALIESRVGLG